MQFDPQKLTDLVAEESRLQAALGELAVSLNDQHATDGAWDDARMGRYTADQQRHGQLTRELGTVRALREAYERLEPAPAARRQSPVARWLRGGEQALDESERESHLGEMIDADLPGGGGLTFRLRAATRSDNASGQEAAEETIVPRIIDRLAYFGGMSRAAHQFRTGTGADYRYMQEDAATQEGALLAAQNTTVVGQDLANIGVVTFGAKTVTSRPIIITREMIQDSVFDVERYAERQALRRMGRTWNKHFTLTQAGSGVVGAVSSAKAGLTAAATAAITWDELTSLVYSVNRAYREGGEMGGGGEMGDGGFMAEEGLIGYMLSDDAEKAARLLKDADNRPLWVPSTREGVPSMLNGWPYVVNGHMDAVATGKVPFLFGNFGYYGIRTVNEVELFRFTDSRTMQQYSCEVLAFSRRDGRPLGALANNVCEAYAKLTMA